jgi:Ca2+-binding RTX toxin-like protein
MARITSREAFDSRSFSFGVSTGTPVNTFIGTAGDYRYGVNLYDNYISNAFNSGASRMLAYANDLTLGTTGLITGGTMNAFLKQNLSGTTWVSSFILSGFEAGAAGYASAIASVGTTDDRTLLNAALVGDDLIALSKYNDYVDSGAGEDTVRSGYGDDTVYGGTWDDFIDGGSGLDQVYGGDGNDYVIGGRGNDTVYGGNDADIIRGGDGDDLLVGGSGADVFYFRMGDDRDTVNTFVQGWDMLQVSGMTATTTYTKVQEGANAVITVLGVDIVLQDTNISTINNADFIFA